MKDKYTETQSRFVVEPVESTSSKCWANRPEEHTRYIFALHGEQQVQEVFACFTKSMNLKIDKTKP